MQSSLHCLCARCSCLGRSDGIPDSCRALGLGLRLANQSAALVVAAYLGGLVHGRMDMGV